MCPTYICMYVRRKYSVGRCTTDILRNRSRLLLCIILVTLLPSAASSLLQHCAIDRYVLLKKLSRISSFISAQMCGRRGGAGAGGGEWGRLVAKAS